MVFFISKEGIAAMQPLQKDRIFSNRQLLTLLWPLIIEQGLNVLVGMADTMMVSSAGEAANLAPWRLEQPRDGGAVCGRRKECRT